MSRSCKKNPVFTDYHRRGTRWAKARANRLFRRCRSERKLRELRSGKSAVHRRYTESWDIHDYVERNTKAAAERQWEREEIMLLEGARPDKYTLWAHYRFKTKERFLNYWEKSMKRK